MEETRWNMKPNKAKAMVLAKRQLAEFMCDAGTWRGLILPCRVILPFL